MIRLKTLVFCALTLGNQSLFAQRTPHLVVNDSIYLAMMRDISSDQGISTDSLLKKLADWNRYPSSVKTDQDYIFTYEDPYYGNVPMRLYVPKTYSHVKKCPLLLLLHGAVRISSFARAEGSPGSASGRNESDDDDLFFDYFREQGYIILRPFADFQKKFNWAMNEFNSGLDQGWSPGNVNLTFKCLIGAITKLKKLFNIDDNKVFAFGHSDGADGAFGLEVFQPSLFAGFLLYNSMLDNLKATNIYPANMENCSTYVVHSDLDDLRAVEQTTAIVDRLKELGATIEYKVYDGYKHFDKHLTLDLPFANKFVLRTTRNPFPSKVYWEAGNAVDDRCFWLKVDSFDLKLPKAKWQEELNFKTYLRPTGTWANINYYMTSPGYLIKASYLDNTFTISTSRILSVEILISEKMVDLDRNVRVILNDNLVFNKRIKSDKQFILSAFKENADRTCIWVNSIKLNINPG
jgi:predicted esterase